MVIYRRLRDPRLKKRPRAVAIGIFDGVHLGHQKILEAMLKSSRRLQTRPMVITFDPHPSKVLSPKQSSPAILMSLSHRLRLLKEMGVRETLIIPFNKKFSKISHEQFLKEILIKHIGMKALSVGHDFRFGYRARGDAAYLAKEAARQSYHFSQARFLKTQGQVISSTRIRRLIEKGELAFAAKMLGRPASVYGTVIHGRGRGKRVGFPTANLNPHHEALPPAGVYAAYGFLDGQKLKAVIHIGERPTFKDKEKSMEAHFLGFHRDIYGREVELIFVKRLRSVTKFRSSTALARAIRQDILRAKHVLRE